MTFVRNDEKIKNDKIYGEEIASRTHFMVGGKVRQTIKDIGGILPEQLPPEKHIRLIKKEIKQKEGNKNSKVLIKNKN